jgi:hypothetical protein
VKRITQRYLIAAGVFAVAALLSGVGLVSGFECLLAFVVTSLVVGVVQRRQLAAEDPRSVRPRSRSRRRPRAAESRDSRRSVPRSRPSRVVYDDEVEAVEWPQLADHGW